MNISDLIKQKIESMWEISKKEKTLNERQTLLKELYDVYVLENKFENYYRYSKWLGKVKICTEKVEEFKKVKLPIEKKYIKPITSAFFAIKLSHIPTEDLYYLVSVKKDSVHRKGYTRSSFTKWLWFSIK
jgi:hypothetical protein